MSIARRRFVPLAAATVAPKEGPQSNQGRVVAPPTRRVFCSRREAAEVRELLLRMARLVLTGVRNTLGSSLRLKMSNELSGMSAVDVMGRMSAVG